MASRPLVSEKVVLAAIAAGQTSVTVPAGALVTAQARDTARDRGVALVPVGGGPWAVGEPEPAAPGGKRKEEGGVIGAGASARAPSPNSSSPNSADDSVTAHGLLPTAHRTLALGCDHAGFAYKSALADHAKSLGWAVVDVGTDSEAAVDYPDFAFAVARAVHTGQVRFGVMVDGVGVGSAMVANKLPGVRAALCPDVFSAFNARAHNDATVLTLGSRTMGVETCRRVLSEFLATPFEGGRHAARVQKIADVEARFLPGGLRLGPAAGR